jgi:tetratricopeptide (TPR) repeat protein
MISEQEIQTGLTLHQAGRLDEAEKIYRAILFRSPGQARALHLLGVLCIQTNRLPESVELIQQAIIAEPSAAVYRCDLAEALRRLGRLEEAMANLQRALELSPNDPLAHSNLGNVLREMGRLEDSVTESRRAIALRPNFAEAHGHLGETLRLQGKLEDAIVALRQASRLRPNDPHAHNNLGHALNSNGNLAEAAAEFRAAIRLMPDLAEAHNNLGCVLNDQKLLEEGAACFRQAIELRPNYAEAYNNLGIALRKSGRIDELLDAFRWAIKLDGGVAEFHNNLGNALDAAGQSEAAVAAVRHAIDLNPRLPEAHSNLGHALSYLGKFDEAIAACRRAIELKADLPDAHWNLANCLLAVGQWREGWREYEWRWKVADLQARRNFSQPRWDGGDLAGKRILLHAEQGFGDTILFARYVPMVMAKGGQVILECQRELIDLLRESLGVKEIVPPGEARNAFDLQCPLGSLPGIFGTEPDSVPAAIPYLRAPSDLVERWRKKIAELSVALNVGLVWAGSPTNTRDRNRSMALPQFAPLAEVRGVRFFNLQKGEPGRQSPPVGMDWVDWTSELADFAQTAGLIANLDLVIAVDTAVAHLAGAMRKRAWALLAYEPGWRWMQGRADSPWYPAVELLRSPQAGDWVSVVRTAVRKLSERNF